ncbi:MAG TPA: transglutaminase family protein [Crinalium sp.]
MHYLITHTTTYTYDQPIALLPHVVRLRPRCDVTQVLKKFAFEVRPKPLQMSENIDLDGNTILKLWFKEESTSSLIVSVTSEVETYRTNPFAYLLEPCAIHLPIDYPASLLSQLQPYLVGQSSYASGMLDPVAIQLAQEIADLTQGNVVSFLSELNQRISQSCQHMIRETGDPFPPGLTWSKKAGSCRDLTVLFMETCRAIGLATRFVSGYQEGDPDWEHRHLHAWAEVYLPGAGWRGYDPTQGLAVSDRHIALVASSSSRYTTPISGSIKGIAQSKMEYKLTIEPRA